MFKSYTSKKVTLDLVDIVEQNKQAVEREKGKKSNCVF